MKVQPEDLITLFYLIIIMAPRTEWEGRTGQFTKS